MYYSMAYFFSVLFIHNSIFWTEGDKGTKVINETKKESKG
jgi:hypothetical protein